MIIYLGRLLPTCSCGPPEAPTPEGRKTSRSGYISLLLFDLTPDRGCPADALLRAPVVSYTTISPLPVSRRYVSVALSNRLPRSGYFPVSCSMECGLSSVRISDCDHPINLGKVIIPLISDYVNYPIHIHSFGRIHYRFTNEHDNY